MSLLLRRRLLGKISLEPSTQYRLRVGYRNTSSDITTHGKVFINNDQSLNMAYFNAGENVTINATPDSGYEFKDWNIKSNGVTTTVTQKDYSFNMPAADTDCSAEFVEETVPTYNVRVAINTGSTGTGTVWINDFAPSEGSQNFYEGDTVNIHAKANLGSMFTKWIVRYGRSGNPDYEEFEITTADHTFSMPAKSVTCGAFFDEIHITPPTPTTYTLTVAKTPAISTGIVYIDDDQTATTKTMIQGATATIHAVDSGSYTFTAWNDRNSSRDRTITMGNADVTYTASFALNSLPPVTKKYTLTTQVTTDCVGMGTTHIGSVTGPASQSVDENASITVYAVPADGHKFMQWQNSDYGGNALSTNTAYTFNMPGNDYTLRAKFIKQQVEADPEGNEYIDDDYMFNGANNVKVVFEERWPFGESTNFNFSLSAFEVVSVFGEIYDDETIESDIKYRVDGGGISTAFQFRPGDDESCTFNLEKDEDWGDVKFKTKGVEILIPYPVEAQMDLNNHANVTHFRLSLEFYLDGELGYKIQFYGPKKDYDVSGVRATLTYLTSEDSYEGSKYFYAIRDANSIRRLGIRRTYLKDNTIITVRAYIEKIIE